MPDLQRIVDDLAARLHRPVLVEDRHHEVAAYSEQTGLLDDVRRDSILRRHTTPEVRRWLRAEGIFESRKPLHIPAAPDLGLLPRICVPAWHEGRLHGFLWMIDAPPMSERDVEITADAAPGLALTLFHGDLVSGLTSHRETEAVIGVLLGDKDAARVLIESGSFPATEPVVVVTIKPRAGVSHDETLEQGLLAARLRSPSRHPLHLVRHDHGVLLSAGRPTGAQQDELHAIMSVPVTIGIGRPRTQLHDAAESYVESLHAAEVAARIPGIGPIAHWSRLGVYRLLTKLTTTEIHPGLERLLADRQHLPLLETLETYLDLAGSASATSRALRLHRTSLYHRLQRVEELADTNLKNGDERLDLHLSLKLARLSGRYQPRVTRSSS